MSRNRTIEVIGNTTESVTVGEGYTAVFVRSLRWSGAAPTSGLVEIEYMDAAGKWWYFNGGNIDLADPFAVFPSISGRVVNEIRVTVSGVSPEQTLTLEALFMSSGNSEMSRMFTQARYPVSRLQVDAGNTGFFDGREMRFFREFNIPSGGSVWTRVTVNSFGIILRLQSITVDNGAIRFRAWRGLTISGVTFELPTSPESGLFLNNNLPSAPSYSPTTVIENGGGHTEVTGGTVAECKRVRSSGSTAQATSIGEDFQGERGIAPDIYHLQLENISNTTATGVYDLIYEERLGMG